MTSIILREEKWTDGERNSENVASFHRGNPKLYTISDFLSVLEAVLETYGDLPVIMEYQGTIYSSLPHEGKICIVGGTKMYHMSSIG